jgi:hypothetical protein
MANFPYIINTLSTSIFNVYVTAIIKIFILIFEIDWGDLFNHGLISWDNWILFICVWLVIGFIWLKKPLNFFWTKVIVCNFSHCFSWFDILIDLIFITFFHANNHQTFLLILTFKVLNINKIIALLILLIRSLRTINYFLFFIFLVQWAVTRFWIYIRRLIYKIDLRPSISFFFSITIFPCWFGLIIFYNLPQILIFIVFAARFILDLLYKFLNSWKLLNFFFWKILSFAPFYFFQ